jgi:mercuric ion transport protein
MSRTWKRSLLALPGVSVSLLPKLACPLCWPAYAGLLGSVGLGFLISAVYLLPLTAAFLVFALAAMAFKANSRHGYGPFLFGLVAAASVLLGKFVWESNITMYSAVGLLVISSIWNAWPRHVTAGSAAICPGCYQKDNELNQRSV